MEQSVEHATPDPGQAVEPVPAGQGEHPAGADLDADLQPRAAGRAQSPCLPITCTSTRNDREAVIGNRSAIRREPFLPLRASLRVDRRLIRASVAAPATNPVAAAAAAWTAGSDAGPARSIVRTSASTGSPSTTSSSGSTPTPSDSTATSSGSTAASSATPEAATSGACSSAK